MCRPLVVLSPQLHEELHRGAQEPLVVVNCLEQASAFRRVQSPQRERIDDDSVRLTSRPPGASNLPTNNQRVTEGDRLTTSRGDA